MSGQGDELDQLLELDQRDRCETCQRPLSKEDVSLFAYGAGELVRAWAFCAACWSLLKHAIDWETQTMPAFNRVRRRRAGWERRRDPHGRFKSDP